MGVIEDGGGKVRFGVDVSGTKRGTVVKKIGGDGEGGLGWERIIFNFPHVGGKTKDVNRQVRFNQGTVINNIQRLFGSRKLTFNNKQNY